MLRRRSPNAFGTSIEDLYVNSDLYLYQFREKVRQSIPPHSFVTESTGDHRVTSQGTRLHIQCSITGSFGWMMQDSRKKIKSECIKRSVRFTPIVKFHDVYL
jgi:hypothetical protein